MMLNHTERQARYDLAKLKGVGPVSFKKILNEFGSAEAFFAKQGVAKSATNVMAKNLVVYGDEDYPFALEQIPDAPPFFYYKGDKTLLSDYRKMISIVGTRRMSAYGKKVVARMVEGLVGNGFVIVSGMALGVDGIAHDAALRHGGKTIAVMGSHIDAPYPLEHKKLYNQICNSGLVISENEDEILTKGAFPRRNRIIAALSVATIVVEAGEKSGSLITANLALNYDREVYAVPGNIDYSQSIGTNRLIAKQEAKVFTSVNDLVADLGAQVGPAIGRTAQVDENITALTKAQRCVIDTLKVEPLSAEQIMAQTGYNITELTKDLMELEMLGMVAKERRGHYTLLV